MSSKFSSNRKVASMTISERRSEVDFWKKSILFFAVVGIVLFIMSISSSLIERQSSGENLAYELYKLFRNPIYITVVTTLSVASVVWFVYTRLIKKKDESLRYFSSLNAVLIMMYVSFFSMFFGAKLINNPEACTFLLCITVAFAIVYYVTKMYNLDFIAYTIETFILALLLYKYWFVYTIPGIIGKLILIASFAAIGFVVKKLLKGYKSRAVNNKKLTYLFYPYWISLAIWSVFMFIKIHNPAGIAVINLATMLTIFLVQYIIFAIVYTIKLIRE